MLQDGPTDEQIAAQEARFARNLMAVFVSIFLLIVAVGLLMLAARTRFIPDWLFNGLSLALFLAWLSYMFIRLTPAPSTPVFSQDENYLRKTIDIRQRNARISLIFWFINLFWLGSVLTFAIGRGGEGRYVALVAVSLALEVLITILNLVYGLGFMSRAYRRAVIDELNRAQRARAVQFGYILAAMEMSAILIAGTYRPHWGLIALPLAIVTAVALPGLYFLYLEWQSDYDG